MRDYRQRRLDRWIEREQRAMYPAFLRAGIDDPDLDLIGAPPKQDHSLIGMDLIQHRAFQGWLGPHITAVKHGGGCWRCRRYDWVECWRIGGYAKEAACSICTSAWLIGSPQTRVQPRLGSDSGPAHRRSEACSLVCGAVARWPAAVPLRQCAARGSGRPTNSTRCPRASSCDWWVNALVATKIARSAC